MAIKFNGKTLPDWARVTGITFQTVNVSIMEHETTKRVGNIDAGINRGGIDINVSIFISPVKGMTILNQSDEIKRFVMGDGWKVSELILLEQPNKFYNARVSNAVDITDAFTHGESEIVFHASDPKKYDVNETVAIGSGSELNIDYSGMEKTPVIVELTIPSNTSKVSVNHVESKKKITILGDFKTGQKLTINTKDRNILLNNETIKNKMSFESNWIYLESGMNTISLSDNNGVVKDFTVTYRIAD